MEYLERRSLATESGGFHGQMTQLDGYLSSKVIAPSSSSLFSSARESHLRFSPGCSESSISVDKLAALGNKKLLGISGLACNAIDQGNLGYPLLSLPGLLQKHDGSVGQTGLGKTAIQSGLYGSRTFWTAKRFFNEADMPDDTVVKWNQALLKAIEQEGTPPPYAARNMAIVHTAIYDAVNSIVRRGTSYHTMVAVPAYASTKAAASQAAYETLIHLYPNQRPDFERLLSTSLAHVPDGDSETLGVAVGHSVAQEILAWRNTDGSNAVVAYTPPTGAGYWQPTPAAYANALLPQWPNVTPFTMKSGSQFRPAGPPAYTSVQYAAELDQVRRYGGATNSERTAEQTEIALFWADGGHTYTPPGHWNEIAESVTLQQGTTLFEQARLFALLNLAVADAGIAAWDTKYTYSQWRPITAIQQTSDPNWKPLLNTPPFPDYISGHSTFSGAASTVLAALLGDNTSFQTTTDGLPGVVRSYSSFSQAANDAGISRIYGGIHVQSANLDGLAVGRAIGNYVVNNFLQI